MSIDSKIRKLKAFDDARPNVKGEHWVAFGLGVACWGLAAGKRPGPVRWLAMAAATGFLTRAVSGRDGLKRYLPLR